MTTYFAFFRPVLCRWVAACMVLLTVVPGAIAESTGSGRDGKALKAKGKRELKVFRLFSASYSDIETVAGEFLSPEGTMRHMKSKNAAVVIDYPENLKSIEEIINALEGDEPPVNIRIEVAFDEVSEGGKQGWEVDPGWPIVIEDGKVKNDRVEVRAGKTKGRGSEYTSQQILTRDGGEASIWVGETVQEPMWVYEYGRRHAWWQADFAEYNFGASLWVRPKRLNNDLVEISVYPRITSRTKERLSVDAKELTVTVLARNGQTVRIGGMDQAKRDAYSKILGRGSVFTGSTLAITLTPSIEKLDRPPPPGTGGKREPVAPITIDRKYHMME